MDKKKFQFNIWYFVIAIIGLMFLEQIWGQHQNVETLPYSQFQQDLQNGKIDKMTVTETQIHGTFKQPQKNGQTAFVTTRDPRQSRPRIFRNTTSNIPAGRTTIGSPRSCPGSFPSL